MPAFRFESLANQCRPSKIPPDLCNGFVSSPTMAPHCAKTPFPNQGEGFWVRSVGFDWVRFISIVLAHGSVSTNPSGCDDSEIGIFEESRGTRDVQRRPRSYSLAKESRLYDPRSACAFDANNSSNRSIPNMTTNENFFVFLK